MFVSYEFCQDLRCKLGPFWLTSHISITILHLLFGVVFYGFYWWYWVFLARFESRGGWFTLKGFLECWLVHFEVSNIHNLGFEGISPWDLWYLRCFEVKHVLGDGRVSVHRGIHDRSSCWASTCLTLLSCFLILCFSNCITIWVIFMLEIMLKLFV